MSLELEGEDEGRRGLLKLIAYYGKNIEGKREVLNLDWILGDTRELWLIF